MGVCHCNRVDHDIHTYLAFSKQAPLLLLLAAMPPKSLSADAVEGAVYFEAREVLSCCFRKRVDFLE